MLADAEDHHIPTGQNLETVAPRPETKWTHPANVEPVPSVEAAVVGSVKVHGDPDIAVVPEGPYVVPLYSASLS